MCIQTNKCLYIQCGHMYIHTAMLVSGWGALGLFLCVCACLGDVLYVCTHKLLHVDLVDLSLCVCVCV